MGKSQIRLWKTPPLPGDSTGWSNDSPGVRLIIDDVAHRYVIGFGHDPVTRARQIHFPDSSTCLEIDLRADLRKARR